MNSRQEDLPAGQYLMLEVLAARTRLGEHYWTFPSSHARIARELESRGLACWQAGTTEKTIKVWLTRAGAECCMSADYMPPSAKSSQT